MNTLLSDQIREVLDETPGLTRQEIATTIGATLPNTQAALSRMRLRMELQSDPPGPGDADRRKWTIAPEKMPDTDSIVRQAIASRHPLLRVWA